MIKNIAFIILGSMIATACASAPPMSKSMREEALSLHNQLRNKHSAPSLRWDNELAKFATDYAARCNFKHSHAGYGENLAAGYRTVSAAILSWYAEGERYSYQRPGFTPGLGHFTQLVWKSSTKLGCGMAACNGKHGTPGNFLVCEYSPAGNVVNPGYFKANVLP
jgi:uncharacterized protein YkwD